MVIISLLFIMIRNPMPNTWSPIDKIESYHYALKIIIKLLNSAIPCHLFFIIQIFSWTPVMIILIYYMIIFFLNVIIQSIRYSSNYINKRNCHVIMSESNIGSKTFREIFKKYMPSWFNMTQYSLLWPSVVLVVQGDCSFEFFWVFPVLFLQTEIWLPYWSIDYGFFRLRQYQKPWSMSNNGERKRRK